MSSRIERDSFGPIDVPAGQLWGAQTQRSLEHFHISTEKMPPELIAALATVKRAAAHVNLGLGLLERRQGRRHHPGGRRSTGRPACDRVSAGRLADGLWHAKQYEHE